MPNKHGLSPHRVDFFFFQKNWKGSYVETVNKAMFLLRIPTDSVLEREKVSQMFMFCEPVQTTKLPMERWVLFWTSICPNKCFGRKITP